MAIFREKTRFFTISIDGLFTRMKEIVLEVLLSSVYVSMVHGVDTGKSVILSIVTIIRVGSGGSSRDFREKERKKQISRKWRKLGRKKGKNRQARPRFFCSLEFRRMSQKRPPKRPRG